MARLRPAGNHRQRQALATRRLVAGAARGLFAEQGYTATSIAAISDRADIPSPTIYSAFGTKRAILEEVRLLWVEESSVAHLHSEAMRIADPRDRLGRAAHWTRRQFDTGHDVIAAYQEAARADELAAQTWRAALAGRETAIRDLLGEVTGSLRPGLTLPEAIDAYIALTLPEIYRTLVVERAWTSERYESWLTAALRAALLGS